MQDSRDDLCRRIARFDEHVTFAAVASTLDSPLLNVTQFDDSAPCTSPLMEACRRGQEATVRYLVSRCRSNCDLLDIIGRPADAKPDTEGNTPAHYAAAFGKYDIMKSLSDMPREYDDRSRYGIELLCKQTNQHSDTPIMIACFGGKEDFVKACLTSLQPKLALEIVCKRNNSNDSALSLACGHGHVRVVEFLVQLFEPKKFCPVQWEDVRRGESVLHRTHMLQKSYKRNDQTCKKISEKLRQVKLCLDLIRDALTRKTDAIAKQLAEEEDKSMNPTQIRRRTKSKPKKKNASTTAGVKVAVRDCIVQKQDEPDDLIRFNTKSCEVVVKETTVVTPPTSVASNCSDYSRDDADAPDELFQDRNNDHALIMKALCLDMSMLLLSSTKMAFYCSSAQLDAMDQILEKQRQAVVEARTIQRRLHNTADIATKVD
jgi:hypothetical protein